MRLAVNDLVDVIDTDRVSDPALDGKQLLDSRLFVPPSQIVSLCPDTMSAEQMRAIVKAVGAKSLQVAGILKVLKEAKVIVAKGEKAKCVYSVKGKTAKKAKARKTKTQK